MKKTLLLTWALISTGLALKAQPKPLSGYWRGVFTLAKGDTLPFNFEIKNESVYLINASERFELTSVRQKGDSLKIPIDIYDAVLLAKIETPHRLVGVFKKYNTTSKEASIPFVAEHGKRFRFSEYPKVARVSLQGKWSVEIENRLGNPTRAVGLFEQIGSKLTGTFLTTTGDYRFFEGSVEGDAFVLSAFSGSNPSLLKGEVKGDTLRGQFIGARGTHAFVGVRNQNAELPDVYALTKLKEGATFDFRFPDAFSGKLTSLQDTKYKGKALIVTILGSWCPNCIDEAAFLAPWYRANQDRGVEVVGLAFERKNDPVFAKERLQALKQRFGITYDLLFAGLADKQYASRVLPALSEVLAFPTTIYIDRLGNVQKIHTGYTGPATGKYYEDFVKEFEKDVAQLLKAEPLPVRGKVERVGNKIININE
jgi:thiol-disulfide isomerase/thioredoxin